MTNKTTPLLVIGTQRSGSNLLRLILNQHPQIEAPHPPHLLQIFYPLLTGYGNLDSNENFKLLVEDIVQYIAVNPVPWKNVNLSVAEITNRCKAHTLVEIFRVVYELKAEAKPAAYWCCKSMANVYYIPEIEDGGLAPFYIHLIRDGRDVAASFKNAIVGDKHIYFIAQQWKKEQELARDMTQKYAPQRTCVIRYEEFIANPETALTPALNMLGLKWDDDMLNFYLSDEAKSTAASGEMWKNVVKPVDNTNARHYSEKLSLEEIAMFETIAGNMLTELAYKTDTQTTGLQNSFTAAEVAEFSHINAALKAEAAKKHLLDAAVRVPQQLLLKKITSRPGLPG